MALPLSVREVYGGLERAIQDSGFELEDNEEIESRRGVEQTDAAAALQRSINGFFKSVGVPVRVEVESFDESQVERLQSDREPNRFVIGASAGLDAAGKGIIYINTVAAEEDFDIDLIDPAVVARNAATVIRHELMHDRQYTSLASRMGISRAEAKQKFEEWGLIPDADRPRTDYLGSHIEVDAFGHEFAERLAQKFGIERAERMVATADIQEMQRLADETGAEMGMNFAEFYRDHPREKFTGRLQRKIRKYLKSFKDEGVYEGLAAGRDASSSEKRARAQILMAMTKQSPGHPASARGPGFPFKEGRLSPGRLLREFARDVADEELVWHRDREDRTVRALEGRGWALQLDGGMPAPLCLGESHRIPAGTWHRLLRRPEATTLCLVVELKKGDRVKHGGGEATVKVPDARGDLVGIDPEGPDDMEMVSADELEPLREKDKKLPGNPGYYVGKKTRRTKSNREMEREIEKCSKEPRPKSCYDEWTADKIYKEKKKSEAVADAELDALLEAVLSEGELSKKTRETLKKKAEKANMPLGALTAVYRKGLAAWLTGHRQGVPQHAWAMARVNSFISGGKARKVDKAEWKKVQKHRNS